MVLCGYDSQQRAVLVADPLERPGSGTSIYPVPIVRVVGSIFLGVLTYDASFLVIEPRPRGSAGVPAWCSADRGRRSAC